MFINRVFQLINQIVKSWRLKELGYELEKENLEKAFESFKKLADLKKEISDRDLEATDIIVASIKASLAAINRMIYKRV